jgi:branched-chain amino acid transport system substrate-binding protein
MIEANGAARELFAKGYHYVFAVLSTSDQYLTPAIDLAAEHAADLGKTPESLRVTLAMENEPVRPGCTRRRSKQHRAPWVSGHEKGALTAVTQIDALKVYVPIIAMTNCDSAQIAEKLGQAAEYVICYQQWHETLDYKDQVFGSAADFAKAFKEAYGYSASYQAAESAAAVEVFADDFKRAQSLDPDKVRDAIAATELDTFCGPVKFSPSGRNIAKPMVLTQVLHGKYVVVAPAKWASEKPVIPRPLL